MRDLIRKDRRLGVQAVAEQVCLDRESVQQILMEELQMRKVCAKMVPKVLSADQKERRKELCSELLQRIADEPDLLKSVITSTLWLLPIPKDQICAERHTFFVHRRCETKNGRNPE